LILSYPKESVQSLIGADSWWIKDDTKSLKRGRLILAYVPHVDQIPTLVTVIGRSDDPAFHDKAYVQFSAFSFSEPKRKPELPVAALPAYPNEVRLVYRAKRRPLLVIGESGPEVDERLTAGKPKAQTAPTLLVAPYYGRDEGTGKRAGYTGAFVERVQHCEYPQFFWDKLPVPGSDESILRFDHIQPIGHHYKTYALLEYRLGEDALSLFDEWLNWFIYGTVDEENGTLSTVFEYLRK
jgi:hypothetical protein